jgi:hypothetical protein
LFLLPRGRPRPRFSTMTGASSRLITTTSAMVIDELELGEGIRKDRCARRKMMWQRWLAVKGVVLRGTRSSPYRNKIARIWARL